MKCRKINASLVVITILVSALTVLNVYTVGADTEDPDYEFMWIDDDGSLWSDNDIDGMIPSIPSIDNLPLIIQFQIVNSSYYYFGQDNQQEAMENITISGDCLYTGTLDEIPGVSYGVSDNWIVPIIPTMNLGGGNISITANAFGQIVKEYLSIGGSEYYNNGSIVDVVPNIIENGTNYTLDITVKTGYGTDIPAACVYLYYMGEFGEGDQMTNQTPITSHLLDLVTSGVTLTYEMEFNTTQQTENQTIAGFDDIKPRRDLIIYARYGAGSNEKYGYAKLEMHPEEEPGPEPEINVTIKRGLNQGATVIISNDGEGDAVDVLYNITVKGGVVGFVNVTEEEAIPLIEADNSTEIKVIVFGIGLIEINVTVGSISKSLHAILIARMVFIPHLFDIKPRK